MLPLTRRRFLGGITGMTAGAVGLSGISPLKQALAAPERTPHDATVSFRTGTDRRAMVYETLKPFENEIRRAIRGRQVVIKPNFVSNVAPLCATHPDAVRGILDFLKPIYRRTVIIGESTVSRTGTFVGYQNFGYMDIPNEFDVTLVDFNKESYSPVWIQDRNGHPLGVNISDFYLDRDNFIISVTRLKTHDSVIATMSLKNILMSAPMNFYETGNEKRLMHEGAPIGLHYNLFRMAQNTMPDLAVIDGVECMQGNGPVRGEAVEHGIAMAGMDPVAVDRIGLELMGIPFEDVAYIKWIADAGMGVGDLSHIAIDGPSIEPYRRTYVLHDRIDWQRSWKQHTITPGIEG